MWILQPLETGGETHYLLPSKEYVVGRKNCDILLHNDQSISRAHAHFTAADQTLTLKDSSKYGTFVNTTRLQENQPRTLKAGDSVTFGVFQSKFSLDFQSFVVCSSCVENDGKALISGALQPLGGKLVNVWTHDCSHLVMPSVKITIKTICALLCCQPIVKQEFFTEFSKALRQKLPPPKSESFIPEVDEPSLNKDEVDLCPKPERKQLFSGKTFIFLNSKQLKRLGAPVRFGGGTSRLLEEGSLPLSLLESPRSCVVDVCAGNSQLLLPPSTVEWSNSLGKILQEKGLRLISESEIGLAAIYASCDEYCNPSSLFTESESNVQKMKPRIPSASLSQNAAVEETVLQAGASLNVTAYVANTEPSQGTEMNQDAGATRVGETPDKSQKRNAGHHGVSKLKAPETAFTVADSVSASFNAVENTGSQREEPRTEFRDGRIDGSLDPLFPEAGGGGRRTFPQRRSPQKQTLPVQGSPQKQSTLSRFFQPVNKKRPREEESSTVQSEPKRAALPAPSASVASKQIPPNTHLDARPPAAAQNQSGSDLFAGQSDALAHGAARQDAQGQKRKEAEDDIDIEELESIMSLEMDYFGEPAAGPGRQEAPAEKCSAAGGQQAFISSRSKRPRADAEENDRGVHNSNTSSVKVSSSHANQEIGERASNITRQLLHLTEHPATRRRPEDTPSDVSFIGNAEPLGLDSGEAKKVLETPQKPSKVKHETSDTKMDEDLPKNLTIVEFKSLTVTAPPKAKPQPMQGNGCTKNFKRFLKAPVPGAERRPHIIGGSDLLAHNRGSHTELDEWLRDTAEEERQSKREESLGDDLFRYNPSKLTKRR